jgi:hypothetical protein
MEMVFEQFLLAPFAVMVAWIVSEVGQEYMRHHRGEK